MLTQYITLDFTRKYLAPIYLNQYEADSRDFVITCTAGSVPLNLTGSSVVFYATKPDETILFNSCTIVDAAAGKVQYTPTSQTCAVAGALTCQVVIIASDSSVLRSMEFTVTVNPGEDYSEAVESTSEYTALDEALALTTGFDARITQNENDIAGKVDGAGTVVDGHIVQFDGTTGKAIKGGLEVTTAVANPGVNTKLPTEQAVRTAIDAACGGDVTGPESSTSGGLVLFNGTSGKTIKEASGLSGIMKGNGATLATATPHSDYATQPVQITSTLTAAVWKGSSLSDTSPSTDISAGSDNKLKIQVDGDTAEEISLTLENCDTGTNIAAELQTKIRALGGNKALVTVEFIGGRYKITSPDDGLVVITDGDTDNVADDLKLGIANGGQEGVMQVIEDDAIYGDEDTCHGDLKIAQGASRAEREAWIAGQIFVVGQDEGVIVVIADGDTPDKDIPVKIEVR